MARSMIVMFAAVLAMGSSCQTSEERMEKAATITGQTRAEIARPETPPSCTAKMERVKPKAGEKARWAQRRWEIVADNRDRLAVDCGAELDTYWDMIEKVGAQ